MASEYSVEQLNLLFANSYDAVFFMGKIDHDYRYLYLNDSAIKLINLNPVGNTVLQVIPPHLSKNILHFYDLCIEQQRQVEFEDYTYSKFEVHKQKTSVIPVIQDDKGYLLAITKKVPVDRDMEDKYLFMRSLFTKSFLSTILVSTDFQLLEANPKFVEDFNIRLADVQGKSIFNQPFIDQNSVSTLKYYLEQAQNGEDVTSKMLHFIDQNKTSRSFTATFSTLKSNGEIIAIFIILQEITDFLKQGKELRTVSHGLETLKSAISSVANLIFTNADGIIIDINARVLENTGYSREELIGKTHSIFNSGYHTKEFFYNLWKTVNNGEIWREEVCNRKKNGELYWVDSTIIPIKNENGEIVQMLTLQYNISSKKQLISELYKIESTFRAITENTNDFIIVANRFGEIKYASPSYVHKLGFEQEELLGQTYERLLTPESLALWQKEISNPNDSLSNKIELQLISKDNQMIWTEGNYTITLDIEQKEIFEIVMVSREITERKELEKRLTYLAYHDNLTHLGNRHLLMKEFPKIVNKSQLQNESLAILYLDGDNFKQVNDHHGHEVGDEFIKQFGQALVRSVRSEDLVVRIGGDEFLIVLTGLSNDEQKRIVQIEHIIERIRQQLDDGWYIREVRFTPTTSIGISYYPQHSESLDTLIDLADQALCKSKQQAKNSYRISDAKMMTN